jgi:feruloyl esterase
MDKQKALRKKLPFRAALATLAAGGSLIAWNAGAATPMNCESLKNSLHLPETTILSSDTVNGPSFTPPGSSTPIGNLPAFCRVAAVIQPQINFEVWLPLSGWNGKFQGTGNGGYNGAIVYSALAAGVQRNYATANSDLGHKSSTPHWAIGRPDLIVDQGYRAQHETT